MQYTVLLMEKVLISYRTVEINNEQIQTTDVYCYMYLIIN